MLNKVLMMGRLIADPELRHTNGPTPIPVCSFRIACDRDYKRGDEKETDFNDCVAWRATADYIAKYFAKGRMIVIEGRLQDKSWTDKEGNQRYGKEIVVENAYFGDSKPKDSGAASEAAAGVYAPAQGGSAGEAIDF